MGIKRKMEAQVKVHVVMLSCCGVIMLSSWSTCQLREGVNGKKKRFLSGKMAFAMKGGGCRGGLECHVPILKNDFC